MNLKTLDTNSLSWAALWLRVGLGTVFIIGGISKLSLLLNSATHQGMVDNYMGSSGYINALFQEFLFSGGWLTPGFFLTSLSAFELISGVMLVAGLMVRPLALFYAFLLWSFVFSLPTQTVPGIDIGVKTYTSPALFVQVRDITLSGVMFVLYNLGAGRASLDHRFNQYSSGIQDWDKLGLLLRLSLGVCLLVGGFFAGFANIQSFKVPGLLLIVSGLLLVFGSPRVVAGAGAAVMAIMVWYIVQKLNLDKSVIANLNGVKREFALLAMAWVLVRLGGGSHYTWQDMVSRSRDYLGGYLVKKA